MVQIQHKYKKILSLLNLILHACMQHIINTAIHEKLWMNWSVVLVLIAISCHSIAKGHAGLFIAMLSWGIITKSCQCTSVGQAGSTHHIVHNVCQINISTVHRVRYGYVSGYDRLLRISIIAVVIDALWTYEFLMIHTNASVIVCRSYMYNICMQCVRTFCFDFHQN